MSASRPTFRPRSPGFSKQRGIATIMIVVLVGLGLTATSVSIMHNVRSAQEKHVAVHASTNAQQGVWVSVEAFRLYLESLELPAIQQLQGQTIPMDFGDWAWGSATASNIKVEADGSKYLVTAEIQSIDDAARASATVGASYEVEKTGSVASSSIEVSAPLYFQGDTHFSGKAEITTIPGQAIDMVVSGYLYICDTIAGSFGKVTTVGDVNLDSFKLNIEELNTSGDVTLGRRAWVDAVYARGSVSTGADAGAGTIWANQTVRLNSTKGSDAVNAIGWVKLWNGATQGIIKSGDAVEVTNKVKAVGSVSAVGSIKITGASATETTPEIPQIGSVVSESTVSCSPSGWKNYEYLSVNNATQSKCGTKPELATNGNNTVSVMQPLEPITIQKVIVDVWPLRAKSNFIVSFDADKNRPMVTVNNINGEFSGTQYWVGNYADGSHNSYLCSAFGEDGFCSVPESPKTALCLGASVGEECLSYDAGTQTFTFSGSSTAPGVMWIDGNVEMANTINYTTFLTTGDFTANGTFRGVSTNFAEYAEICTARGENVDKAIVGTYTSRFSKQYPTDLCNLVSREFTAMPVGNASIIAGGMDPVKAGYFGGDVNLRSGAEIYGSIMAGKTLTTTGATPVFGYIVTGADSDTQGTTRLDKVVMDLTKRTKSYNPERLPGGSGGQTTTSTSTSESPKVKATLKWSKYL